MGTNLLDNHLAPFLVPTIMAINSYKLIQQGNTDSMYMVVTFGLLLSLICNSLQFRLSQYSKSRTRLTLISATIMTIASVSSIVGYHAVRINAKSNEPLRRNDLIRYHLYADILPGLLVFSKTQLCVIMYHELINRAKRKFSVGEATIIAQLSASVYLTCALVTYSKITSGAGHLQISPTNDIVLSIASSIFCIAFVPSYLCLRGRRSTAIRYSLIAASLLASYFLVNCITMKASNSNPMVWFVDYIFSTHQRLSLFSLWLATLAACISLSTSWARIVGKTNSIVRKAFHLAVSIVFVSGYNQDLEFTRFAAGGCVVVMLLLEMVRASDLKPIGQHIERVCGAMRGHWDNKFVTVSHIYLLVGTFLPLWLLPSGEGSKLTLSSGLISVGVGDTSAAIVGTFLGKTQIRKNSPKTLEGTLANLLAMILFKLLWVGYSDIVAEFSFIFIAILTSHVELTTDYCDNLILPLVMILFLEIF